MVVAEGMYAVQEARVRRACAQLPDDEWRTVSPESFVGAPIQPSTVRARKRERTTPLQHSVRHQGEACLCAVTEIAGAFTNAMFLCRIPGAFPCVCAFGACRKQPAHSLERKRENHASHAYVSKNSGRNMHNVSSPFP